MAAARKSLSERGPNKIKVVALQVRLGQKAPDVEYTLGGKRDWANGSVREDAENERRGFHGLSKATEKRFTKSGHFETLFKKLMKTTFLITLIEN
jgi:hypothetical protein